MCLLASQNTDTFPIGTILPYVGDLHKIPNGWKLCDGTDGTPDLTGRFLEGATTNVGQFKEAGLPNITGSLLSVDLGDMRDWQNLSSYKITSGGAFVERKIGSPIGNQDGGANYYFGITDLNASFSNSIYGQSNTVQPASYTVYYILRVK